MIYKVRHEMQMGKILILHVRRAIVEVMVILRSFDYSETFP